MAGALELQATSADRSVPDTLDYVREITALTRDHIPRPRPGPRRRRPAADRRWRQAGDAGAGCIVRLRGLAAGDPRPAAAGVVRAPPSGGVRADLPGRGTAHRRRRGGRGPAYANWAGQLFSPAQCAALLPPFCAEVGLPASAAGFQAQLQARLTAQAAESDAWRPGRASS